MIRELGAEDIVLSYSGRTFSGIKAGPGIIGQERALGLLRLGLSIDRIGYNIFISGDAGQEILSATLSAIDEYANDTWSKAIASSESSVDSLPYSRELSRLRTEEILPALLRAFVIVIMRFASLISSTRI